MTSNLKSRLEALAEKATPGPWGFDPKMGWISHHPDPLTNYVIAELQSSNDANAALIVELVNALPEIIAALSAAERVGELEEALGEARRAIGDHFAPNDCYATGPLTGNDYLDLVVCPACSFISTHDAILAKQEQQ